MGPELRFFIQGQEWQRFSTQKACHVAIVIIFYYEFIQKMPITVSQNAIFKFLVLIKNLKDVSFTMK